MRARFNIVQRRRWFFLLSGAITVAGLIVFLLYGFNLGTDFKSGSRVQLQLNQTFSDDQIIALFKNAGIALRPENITAAGAQRDVAVVRVSEVLSPKQIDQVRKAEHAMFPKSHDLSSDMVDPFEAKLISQKAVWSILLASLFIVIYVAIRFEYRFAISGIVALLHDAFIVMSVFALLRLEVDLLFVTAVLTIVGYSINDTIVIFDRIRENLKLSKPKDFDELQQLVDKSLWQTMSRSINTVITVLIAAVILYFFGGASIHNFTFALIVGLVSGAYSSIFIASPLWVAWRGWRMKRSKPSDKPA